MITVDRICGHTFVPSLLSPGSNVLDLGANMGDFSRQIAAAYKCNPVAVEPLPGLCPEALQLAIAGKEGRIELKVEPHRCASILGPGKEIQVQTITLEGLVKRLDLSWIDLLKVDIEGAEIEMFDSTSLDFLSRFGQITIEFHDRWFPELVGPVKRVREHLTKSFHEVRFSLDNTDVLYINPTLPISSVDLFWLRGPIKYAKGIRRRFALGAKEEA